jgi:hypothetical protein
MTLLRNSNAPIGLGTGKPISSGNPVLATAWVRPTDWSTFTDPTVGEEKIIGTVAVYDAGSNYIALTMTVTDGTQYTVDWGDGTTTDYNSGVVAERNYAFSSLSAGTLTSLGYRQAVITITPKTAGKHFLL